MVDPVVESSKYTFSVIELVEGKTKNVDSLEVVWTIFIGFLPVAASTAAAAPLQLRLLQRCGPVTMTTIYDADRSGIASCTAH